MGTRSTISVLHSDGTVSSIYCHWDGYLEHNGYKLLTGYRTQEQVEELVNLGDLSSLDVALDKCVAYHRDRGEDRDHTKAVQHQSIAAYMDNLNVHEYNYLFANGKWFWAKRKPADPFLSTELTQQQVEIDQD